MAKQECLIHCLKITFYVLFEFLIISLSYIALKVVVFVAGDWQNMDFQ